MTQLVFFDLDGTLSAPEYRDGGKPVIGFHTSDDWVDYCNTFDREAYLYCRPVLPVKRYAVQKKTEGARLFVLTTILCESEVRAKEAFLERHYSGLFEELITVDNTKEKRTMIKAIAARENIPLERCELVEDTFMTLLDVISEGIEVTHLSELVEKL